MKKRELNTIGKIIKLSGNSGEFIVFSPFLAHQFSDYDIPVFIEINNQPVPFFIEQIRPINNEKSVIKFQAVNSEKKASAYINKNLFIEGAVSSVAKEFGIDDLIGFSVIDNNYGSIGFINSIDTNPKNPILQINHPKGEILLPFNKDFILNIDTENREIQIKSPDGLIELYLGEQK